MISELRVPVIAAPMAGGPSTPELVAAVGGAGGLGFLAGGYLTTDALADQLAKTTQLTAEPFGVNLFVPGSPSGVDTEGYRARMRGEAGRYGVEPGDARWNDDNYPAKLDLVIERRVPVVSFTFGRPDAADVDRLHAAGAEVMVTVTGPAEAALAAAVGVDALCVQGFESGGHRGVFVDDPASPTGGEPLGLLAALRLVGAEVALPLVAAGGIVHGRDVAAVLTGGAVAAQCGTAFLRSPEAGTAATQRDALATGGRATTVTRAFSGRPARGLVNRFLVEHTGHAPSAYPEVNNLTRPIRAAAGAVGDPEAMSLFAGQTYSVAPAQPAAEVVGRLHAEALSALEEVRRRLPF